MADELAPELAALALQPRATETQPLAWTLEQAVAVAPIVALVTVLAPATTVTALGVARGQALPHPAHAYARVRWQYKVDAALRGALAGAIEVDAALWRLALAAHRRRVLQGRTMPVSVPRVLDGDLASPLPGQQVLVLLRQTADGWEFIGQNAVLHVELLPVVQALVARAP